MWSKGFFAIYLEKVNSELSSVFKGFRRFFDFSFFTVLHAPKAGALPSALHPDKVILKSGAL